MQHVHNQHDWKFATVRKRTVVSGITQKGNEIRNGLFQNVDMLWTSEVKQELPLDL